MKVWYEIATTAMWEHFLAIEQRESCRGVKRITLFAKTGAFHSAVHAV
jgi:hypothetical protein